MKARMLMSILVITLAAAMVGGATMALFTDVATNVGNSFAAGTVNVEAGISTIGVGAGNMAPGDTVTNSFVVTNDGTLELRFTVTAATAGALFAAPTPATVGGLADDQNVVLAPGASHTVNFTVSLPIGAGNAYQDADGVVDFTINAVQTANNPL